MRTRKTRRLTKERERNSDDEIIDFDDRQIKKKKLSLAFLRKAYHPFILQIGLCLIFLVLSRVLITNQVLKSHFKTDGLHTASDIFAIVKQPSVFHNATSISVSVWFLLKGDSSNILPLFSTKDIGCDNKERGVVFYIEKSCSERSSIVLEWEDSNMQCQTLFARTQQIHCNVWHNAAFTMSKFETNLFLNGLGISGIQSSFNQVINRDILIGQTKTPMLVADAIIASVSIWDHALSHPQIKEMVLQTVKYKGFNFSSPHPSIFLSMIGANDNKPAKEGNLTYIGVPGMVDGANIFLRKHPHFSSIAGDEISDDDRGKSDTLGAQRANRIRNSFKHAWEGYKTHAWGSDELRPVSGGRTNKWGGLGVTLIDSLDTLWILGLKKEFLEARDWVQDQLTFEKTGEVSVFETTIRVLGGLLSAFELSKDRVFLTKAEKLGKILLQALDTQSGIPLKTMNLRSREVRPTDFIYIASAGSLQLEFRYLSQKTGNPEYAEKANRVFQTLQNSTTFEGLVPYAVSPQSSRFFGKEFTFGAHADSYYEYLLKTWLQGCKEEMYLRAMYDEAIQGLHDHLLQKSFPSGLTYIAKAHIIHDKKGQKIGIELDHTMEHLACFVPAMLILGAVTNLDGHSSSRSKRDIKVAKELAYTCYQMYNRQNTGLSPDVVNFQEGKDFVVPLRSTAYLLRPEVAETLFYMYFFTKDIIYREWSWEIFQSIEKYCGTSIGYASYPDIRNIYAKPKDEMESYFLSETLKYLYLIQQPGNEIDLLKYVLNTEAHPFSKYYGCPT